jgi:glycosyltransferase involved in cell wall biosynthesis
VMNARERWQPDQPLPAAGPLRDLLASAGADRDVMLYQGAFRPDQGLETLVEALDGQTWTPVFLGFGPLEERLRAVPGACVLPPVPSDELLAWTAGADVAFVGAPPATRNQTLTTPNKLFEAAMAGVPVVVAGGTWTARLVVEHDLGVVVEPWTASGIGAAIDGLLDAPAEAREARRRAIRATALTTLNWETERDRLVSAFRRLR